MSEHEHGSMDPTPHQKTFEGFLKVAAGVAILTILILVFLAIVGT
jgi:hypothetical protein